MDVAAADYASCMLAAAVQIHKNIKLSLYTKVVIIPQWDQAMTRLQVTIQPSPRQPSTSLLSNKIMLQLTTGPLL